MLEFKDISIQDKERYDYYRNMDKTNASEGSFITLFIWNGYYNLQVAENGEFFFIRFNIKNKVPAYLFPIGSGDVNNALSELKSYSEEKGEKLKFILTSEKNKDKAIELLGEGALFYSDRDCADYVYLVEKMISLSGKKLHAKRNHLNYFLENYKYEYESVTTKEQIEECALKAYNMTSAKTKNKNPYEPGAMKAYFENFKASEQKGGIIRIDGEIVAMSFGQALTDDTALIQIELANEEYRGAYQAINKLFCEKEWADFKYINREEDMGIEGMRKAKLAYRPEFLIEKYVICEK